MRIIARRSLREFIESKIDHKDYFALKSALECWFSEVSKASWNTTQDIKRLYAHAIIISSDRVVFNIKGNDYRLVIAVDFEKSIVWIKWIGTNKAYDQINVREIEYAK